MARAETVTKLPLDEWARIFGLDPLHFNFVEHVAEDPNRTAICKRPWIQYPWQGADQIGRDDLATAIAEAEAQIEDALGYHLMPTWDYDEWKAAVRPNRPELVVTNFGDVRGYARVVPLQWGYFISGGVEAATLVGGAVPVVYTDEDNDNYKETATIGPLTTNLVTDPAEVEVHLPPTAHAGEYDEKNRIRPVAVRAVDNHDGTFTYTLRCRREQLVPWEKLTDIAPITAVDGAVDGDFAATVEVWRHYNDPQTQATLLWEQGDPCGTCNGAGCTSCQYGAQTACLIARGDPRHSMVAYIPANWDAATRTFSSAAAGVFPALNRDADVIRAFYRSGWQAKQKATIGARWAVTPPNQVMDPTWARVVAHFAASKLDRPVCDCGYAAQQIDYWNHDLAYSGGSEQLATFSISQKDLDNPFGTMRGAVMAWKAVSSAARGRTVLV